MTFPILSTPINAFDVSDRIQLNLTLDQVLRIDARIKWLKKEDSQYGLSLEDEEELKILKSLRVLID